jgi:hypothetical protein
MTAQAGDAGAPGYRSASRTKHERPWTRTIRVDAMAGHGPALAGLVSAAFLHRVSGGQPLLLRHRGHVAAVLLDSDTYAELQAVIAELLDTEASA